MAPKPTPPAAHEIPISRIVVGQRHRKDLGDLQSLADSIAAEGLLQPVAVTEGLHLVAGERRLRAVELLGRTTIAAYVVNVTSILAGEYAENVIRKDFTVSERVALGDQIKAAIGDRQGIRADKELPHAHAEVPIPSSAETRMVAANLAGFSSHFSHAAARTVLERGSLELIAAMDAEVIPVSVAAELTALEPDAQAAVVKDGRLSVQVAAKALRHLKAVERGKVVPRFHLTALAQGTYPCTMPDCTRGPEHPFSDAGTLGNHRFTAHGIRSTNHESVARQARRDRVRVERAVADNPKPPTVLRTATGINAGPLDPGEREHLRRKVLVNIGVWSKEFRRAPKEVAAALFALCLDGLRPPTSNGRRIDPDSAYVTTGGAG